MSALRSMPVITILAQMVISGWDKLSYSFSLKGQNSVSTWQTEKKKKMGLLIFMDLFVKKVSRTQKLWFLRKRPSIMF